MKYDSNDENLKEYAVTVMDYKNKFKLWEDIDPVGPERCNPSSMSNFFKDSSSESPHPKKINISMTYDLTSDIDAILAGSSSYHVGSANSFVNSSHFRPDSARIEQSGPFQCRWACFWQQEHCCESLDIMILPSNCRRNNGSGPTHLLSPCITPCGPAS